MCSAGGKVESHVRAVNQWEITKAALDFQGFWLGVSANLHFAIIKQKIYKKINKK